MIKTIQIQTTEKRNEALLEVKILKNLKHPYIIHFREYTQYKNTIYIIMDYANGGDLCQKIKNQREKGKYFSENQILDYFTQICLAIKHIHDRKILHRDIKSQNIFLMKDNKIKLGDFGIAKCLNNTFEKAKTLIGTPYYLSPEIINDKPYDYKSDIWSLGILLYEICALKMPFEGFNMPQLYMKISTGNYPPLSNNFSQDLRNLINAMLNVNSSKRPSIVEILRNKIIKPRIKNFLNENEINKEFSHSNALKKYNDNGVNEDKDKDILSENNNSNKMSNKYSNNYKSNNLSNFHNKEREREKNIMNELNLLKKDLAGPTREQKLNNIYLINYNNNNGNNINFNNNNYNQNQRNISDKKDKNYHRNNIQNSERKKNIQKKEFSDKDNSKITPTEFSSKNSYNSNNKNKYNIINYKYSDRNNKRDKEQKSNLQDLMKQMRKKLKNEQEKDQGVIWMKGMENFIDILNENKNNNNNQKEINNQEEEMIKLEKLQSEDVKQEEIIIKNNIKDFIDNNYNYDNDNNNLYHDLMNGDEISRNLNINYNNVKDDKPSSEKIDNLLYEELVNDLGKEVLLDLSTLIKKFVNDNIINFDYEEINKNIKEYYEKKEVANFIIDKAISKIPDIYYLMLEEKINYNL